MDLTVDLESAELAHVNAEVERLQRNEPGLTAEVFLARMTKKLVGKWVAEVRHTSMESIQSDFGKLAIEQRDEALLAFRAKLDELRASEQDVIEGRQ